MMYAFGFSINTLTLLAMVLAIGLVVDDAIVVLGEHLPAHRGGDAAAAGGLRRRARDRVRGDRDDADPGVGLSRRSRSRPAAPGGSSSNSRWRWPGACWSPGSSR
jgi:hypothetical protein